MKLEVGKSYNTENGLKVTVHAVDLNLGGGYSVLATSFESGEGDPAIDCIETYTAEGRWVDESAGHEKDIVSEYNERLDVPVDTKIRVRESERDIWENRHFARWDPLAGKVRAWEWGKTSHTIDITDTTCTWKYAEVVK